MKHSKYPGPTSEKHPLESGEVVPPVFRVGDDARNREAFIRGKRVLSWTLTEHDRSLAETAGWDIFPTVFTGELGQLQLPAGTRNARSILSGVEAWDGEKRSIVEPVANYLSALYRKFGQYDTDFSWGQVGVTPMHEVFVAPPNSPHQASPDLVGAWKQTLISELDLMLGNDDENRDLAHEFAKKLQRNPGDDR